MNIWVDEIVIKNTPYSRIVIMLIFLVEFFCIYMGLDLFLLHPLEMTIIEKICFIAFLFYVLILIYNGISLIKNGGYLIRSITLQDNNIIIENGFHKKIIFKNLDLISIEKKIYSWKVFEPYFDKSPNNGFFIHFKNNATFRISPNIEKIEELREKLKKIIQLTWTLAIISHSSR